MKKYAALLPKTPQGVGRPIGDRQAWQAVAKRPAFHGVVARAEKLLKTPMPELTDDAYLDFSRTGNRSRGERVIGQRHSRLPQLVLAECIEDRGRFLPAIEATIRAIAAEKSWTLPAHDRSLKNFNGTELDIDLASLALSWNLATADYWLGDKLDAGVRKLVRSELERRCFAPFRGYVLKGKPKLWWATGTNNWNAVCLGRRRGGLGDSRPPNARAFFAASADQYINHFLKGFADDGYCGEGLGYWNYGFGHFLLLSETLYQATGGKVDLMERPKVRQITQFGRRLEILPRIYPAFADCSVTAQPGVEIMAYVSRRFGLGWLDEERRGLLLARGSVGQPLRDRPDGFPQLGFRLGRPPPRRRTARWRDWFADAEILVCRPAPGSRHALGAAIKGGRNAGSHCHNDVGSYVVALGQSALLVDPGSEVYTARTFSAHRFDSKVLNSFGHSVPRVAGKLAGVGEGGRPGHPDRVHARCPTPCRMDIRSAYAVAGADEAGAELRFFP